MLIYDTCINIHIYIYIHRHRNRERERERERKRDACICESYFQVNETKTVGGSVPLKKKSNKQTHSTKKYKRRKHR